MTTCCKDSTSSKVTRSSGSGNDFGNSDGCRNQYFLAPKNFISEKGALLIKEYFFRDNQYLGVLYYNKSLRLHCPMHSLVINRSFHPLCFKESSESKLSKERLMSRLDSDSIHSYGSRRSSRTKSSRRSKSSSSDIDPEEEKRNLKKMLLTLIEKADFLVEDDLNALMAVLPDKDKLLLKVDSILGALGVKEERDIEKIFNHLTKNADNSGSLTDSNVDINKEIVTTAEKRSKILKILREYVEEPESADRTHETRNQQL